MALEEALIKSIIANSRVIFLYKVYEKNNSQNIEVQKLTYRLA